MSLLINLENNNHKNSYQQTKQNTQSGGKKCVGDSVKTRQFHIDPPNNINAVSCYLGQETTTPQFCRLSIIRCGQRGSGGRTSSASEPSTQRPSVTQRQAPLSNRWTESEYRPASSLLQQPPLILSHPV